MILDDFGHDWSHHPLPFSTGLESLNEVTNPEALRPKPTFALPEAME